MENAQKDKIFNAYIKDKIEICLRRDVMSSSYFLDERQQTVAERCLKKEKFSRYGFFGGFSDAQRKMLILLPADISIENAIEREEVPISYLKVAYGVADKITHRDILGSMIGAGIRRESIGDILIFEGFCEIIVERSVVSYLLSNFERVGRYRCSGVTEIAQDDILIPRENTKIIKDTIASPRLDAVLSSAFSMSREKAAALVKSGRVAINHFECEKPDKQVACGDVISARGFGKIELSSIGGRTKKGRAVIEIKKFV